MGYLIDLRVGSLADLAYGSHNVPIDRNLGLAARKGSSHRSLEVQLDYEIKTK
jgi:hypothetical protein